MPKLGIEQKQPQDAGDRRRDRIRQQQHRLVEGRAAHDPVGHHREQQPGASARAATAMPKTKLTSTEAR